MGGGAEGRKNGRGKRMVGGRKRGGKKEGEEEKGGGEGRKDKKIKIYTETQTIRQCQNDFGSSILLI